LGYSYLLGDSQLVIRRTHISDREVPAAWIVEAFSMWSKMVILAGYLVSNEPVPISALSVETNDSAMASSSADPALPIEGKMPASFKRSPKESRILRPRSE
jgi:hypothetical protein